MTTRRSFFKSLALLGSAVAGCPGIFIPKFEPVHWVLHRKETDFEKFLRRESERLNEKIVELPPTGLVWNTTFNVRDYYGKWQWEIDDK